MFIIPVCYRKLGETVVSVGQYTRQGALFLLKKAEKIRGYQRMDDNCHPRDSRHIFQYSRLHLPDLTTRRVAKAEKNTQSEVQKRLITKR